MKYCHHLGITNTDAFQCQIKILGTISRFTTLSNQGLSHLRSLGVVTTVWRQHSGTTLWSGSPRQEGKIPESLRIIVYTPGHQQPLGCWQSTLKHITDTRYIRSAAWDICKYMLDKQGSDTWSWDIAGECHYSIVRNLIEVICIIFMHYLVRCMLSFGLVL